MAVSAMVSGWTGQVYQGCALRCDRLADAGESDAWTNVGM